VNIWIVNPFDPLPGDPEQEGRYATLARLLAGRGHRVVWWTSSFSHRFKRPVDQVTLRAACSALGIEVEFLTAPPYYANVSLRRVWNHHVLAQRFVGAARTRTPAPDVVVASSPPPGLAWRAVEVARARGARAVVDVQDAWPDVFTTVAPPVLRPAVQCCLPALRRNVRRIARACDAIVGVADGYVDLFARHARKSQRTATIPLGVDLAAFDAAVQRGRSEAHTKPAGEIWLAYTGSLNRSYDFMTILRAAARLGADHRPPLRFFLTGRGELTRQAEELVRAHSLSNVHLTGFLPFDTWAYLLSQCDIGFNASFPEAMIYLPNKIFYYLAAGVAVLNTIPGQCSRIVRDGACGLDYRAGDPDSCAAAIRQLIGDEARRAAMRAAARRLAEREYDRAVLFPRYVTLLEELGPRVLPADRT